MGGTGRKNVLPASHETYALASAFVLGLILLPTLSYILFSVRIDSKRIRKVLNYIPIAAGVLFVCPVQ